VWQNFVTEEHNPIVIIRKKFRSPAMSFCFQCRSKRRSEI